MSEVEGHLGLVVGFLPEGCTPVGLDGDGRGRVFGAAFVCLEGAALRVERLDSALGDDGLPAAPTDTGDGSIEWRHSEGGDVIRIVSDELDVGVLMQVAESIQVHHR